MSEVTFTFCDECLPMESIDPHLQGWFRGNKEAAVTRGWSVVGDTAICPDCLRTVKAKETEKENEKESEIK